ncbi:MAG: ATP-binding protein [Boseongicola sp.]|nr:ATP-binding protein [Boseongicola sp.]NNJ68137.1 ATP-binding protein [Boseongicola sp.]
MNHVRADPPATAAGGVLSRSAFRATFENVRLAIENAMLTLEPLNLREEEKSSVEIALAEALNNVVEHAYPDGTPGDVKLVLRHGRAGLLIEIRDNGRPMPNGRTPDGNHPTDSEPHNDLPEGGFGWFLIRELARDLVYDRENGENFLIFRLAVGRKKTPVRPNLPT